MTKKRKAKKFLQLILPGLTRLLIEEGRADKTSSIDEQWIIDLYVAGNFKEMNQYLKAL